MKPISYATFNKSDGEVIAQNGKWRRDRQQFLYKTPKGNYMLHLKSNWQGETDQFFQVEESDFPTLAQKYFTGEWNRCAAFDEVMDKMAEAI